MTMININPFIEDPFNRYQMPRLIIKSDSKGYGMKTTLLNLREIAKDLHRPPIYLAQYLCYKLSVPVKKNTKDDLYIVKGTYDREILQNHIYDFIEQFVLCLKCSNPETNLDVRKNGEIDVEVHQICIACGYSRLMDTKTHKLTNYIAKHPPPTEIKGETSSTSAKNLRLKLTNNIDSQDDDKQISIGFNDKANTTVKSNVNNSDNDNDDWGDDNNLYKSVSQRCDIYNRLIENKKKEEKLNDIETVKELIYEAEHLNIKIEALFVVGKCLFTENILKDINQYKLLLSKLCTKNPKGQIYLLQAFEVSIDRYDEVTKKNLDENIISKIFSKFYFENIIEEDTFYEWHKQTSKHFIDQSLAHQIRTAAERFIEWLRTAEESSGTDD